MSPEELVSIVDREGTVLRAEPRSVVRRDNLLHAATAVLVRSPDRAIYVHRRSDTKDWAPGQHDAAAGGVMQFDEQPEPSARRELAEELGVAGVPLRPLGTSLYEDDTTRCLEYVFEATWDGPVVHQPSEVVWGAWMTLPELAGRLADPGWPFVPDTRQLLSRLAAEGVFDYTGLTVGSDADRE
jgi:8-oxo-dGTP pyrophosphatase MutT (NUDIX family)